MDDMDKVEEVIIDIDTPRGIFHNTKLPWYKKDRLGWPITTFKNKPIKSVLRIIVQNIRKVIG